ncbi:MAG: CpaF family protein [Lachnospiraceae bacterium]|nr:CpaF family protein [Lachnospiraceae bacterium]
MRKTLHEKVISGIDFSRQMSDAAVMELIDSEVIQYAGTNPISLDDMRSVRQDLYHSIRQLDVLQDLIEDPEITEIMINGPDRVFIEKDGRITRLDIRFSSAEKLEDVIQKIVADCNRVVNRSDPIADARLPGGERVSVVLPPVALDGPILTIRRFPPEPITMKDLIRFGSISQECALYLETMVKAGYNVFISGGTGSGKTTFLNALSDAIPKTERIITIEDNAELQIRHIPNLVRLEAREASVDGCRRVSIRDLIRASLRMRPDRIIVGEVRGEEAIDMIQAMNTGHDGSMSTGHANTAADMLARLETMIQLGGLDLTPAAIRSQIASGIDLVVHLGRLRDRSRKLLEISEIDGVRDGNIALRTIYRFREEGEKDGRVIGGWVMENPPAHLQKLSMAGLHLPDSGICGVHS